MSTVSPWSVKGVEPEAREAAKIAARRAGMTVGQWLNKTIRSAAAEQLTGPSRPPVGPRQVAHPSAEQLPRVVPPSAPPTVFMEKTMKRLSERLAKIEAIEKAGRKSRRPVFFRRDG